MSLEDGLYPLLGVYDRLPEGLRRALGRGYRLLPRRLRLGRHYLEFRELSREVENWTPDAVREYQLRQLRRTLVQAASYCPFYQRQFARASFRPDRVQSLEDLAGCPYLEKRDLVEHLPELTSGAVPAAGRLYVTTGGSTGVPVGFYLQKGISRPKEQAFLEAMWERAGYREGARLAVIRGQVTSSEADGVIARYDATRDWLMLSSYHLTEQRLPEYLEALERFQPDMLHAYPSSALQLAEFMERHGQSWRIRLRAVLCGSERLTVPQKRLLEGFFGCRVYRWYGHSERVVLAGEGRRTERFYFWPQYGLAEFGPPDAEGYREVIGTSFHNMAMPLIRYRTGDYVRVANPAVDGEPEWPWPAVTEVAGREQEFLVSGTGRRISLTAFNMHDGIFDDLYAVQFYQESPGEAEFRYVASPRFHTSRLGAIESGIRRKLGDDFRVVLRAVSETEKTQGGKHRWVVSRLAQAGSGWIPSGGGNRHGGEEVVKQIAQYQDGRLEIQEVPIPVAPPGGVLVRVSHSVISSGTERMKVEQARMNLLQKAMARPDQVRKVMDSARTLGWRSALEKVRNRLESPSPLGYSAAGSVVAVDPANTRYRVGDRVACGGAECAFHAEYIGVPDLLTAPVPEGVPGEHAAYTTLCAIGLQAVRQAEPRLGDRAVVLGQGLVGLLITNLLAVSGVRVLAVDVLAARRSHSEALGAERVVILGQESLEDAVRDWTGGQGVDAVVVCTASERNTPIEQAAAALRDRGRLVIVGNTHVDLSWWVFTYKEIEVRYSRSYGPGRYDPAYEWGGQDYPIGYVRWTEQRNFQACLHLMERRALALDRITTRRVPFERSLEVYAQLGKSGEDVGIVLEYGLEGSASAQASQPIGAVASGAGEGSAGGVSAGGTASTPVGDLDVIGAGNFARTMLLPHLAGRIRLGTVVNQTALSAGHVRTKFGFAAAGTDVEAAWAQPGARAVVIATRHHLHAPLVVAALERGRHVFVEKPLCLTPEELAGIDRAVASGGGSVLVGFNRRFARATQELTRQLSSIPGPRSASYRVMAGRLDPKHWYANLAESGGRVVGEACHFLDFFCHVFGSKPVRVFAQGIGRVEEAVGFVDSFSAQVEFEDGSSGQLIYSADGDSAYPKEQLTVYGSGMVAELTNFQELIVHRGRRRTRSTYSGKGHAEEMAEWLDYLAGKRSIPIPYEQSRQSMRLTFAVLDSIRRREAMPVG